MNREAWLTEISKRIVPVFKGLPMGPFQVTCGWPCRFALGRRRRAVGECHAAESSKAGVYEIFISPLLEKPLEVAGTLIHEMAHIAAGIPAGHGKGFVRVCRHVGLTSGKPTSVMPGALLNERLEKIIADLPTYPHVAMSPVFKRKPVVAKAVTAECPDCGCRVRITFAWIEKAGLPRCGCGGQMGASLEKPTEEKGPH